MPARNAYFQTGIETLDALFDDGGIPYGSWVALIGEPGSLKTLTMVEIAANYVLGTENGCAIFVAMEYPALMIKEHFYQMGYDPDEIDRAVEDERLSFLDVFNREKGARETPDSISRIVGIISARMKEKHHGNVIMMIDGISEMWKKAAVMALNTFGMLTRMLHGVIEMGFFTQRLAIGTGEGFGWGTSHGTDTLIKFGKYYHDGYKQWIFVEKNRGGAHDRKLHEYYINDEKNLVVGDVITTRGRFKNLMEAIDSLKESEKLRIENRRNMILERIAKALER